MKQLFKKKFIIIGLTILVVICIVVGIVMMTLGIYKSFQLKENTKNYVNTNGYYQYYKIFSSDEDGTTYQLIYHYEVDGNIYMIMTDYGTSYIPEQSSVREVKYNPSNPTEAILVGAYGDSLIISIGIFFFFVYH